MCRRSKSRSSRRRSRVRTPTAKTRAAKRIRDDSHPSFPDAVVEARGCLRLARKTGEIAAMRAMIKIRPNEERALRRMSEVGELAEVLVWRAVEFRKAVLAEFDKLLAASKKADLQSMLKSAPDEYSAQRNRCDAARATTVDARATSRAIVMAEKSAACDNA